MRLTDPITSWLANRLRRIAERRRPDYIVGDDHRPYLRRWWLIPRNRWFNVYLHQFLRDDDDRALHDHPWIWCSLLLSGRYREHTIAAGGIHRTVMYTAGSLRIHVPRFAHRLALQPGETCWTLFITGPRVRHWGFHCPGAGWVHWERFTAKGGRTVGRGCEP